ncbi:MAG: proteasome assembly chaperone family protein [Candidatus Micrarchaeota archaeon]|nr:proteasome assembly chaperone family protein [Candidatus Micrarchaeota archaeon]
MIEIKLFKKVDLSKYTFIEGFPGIGLVGPMAISYIIDKMGLDYVGYMESTDFPPLISVHDTRPMPPIRVYVSQKYRIVTIFAEFAVPLELVYDMTNAVYGFITNNKISGIFSISGIPVLSSTGMNSAMVVASRDNELKLALKVGLKPIKEGVATGITALLLKRSALDGFPDTSIMVPLDQSMANPKYAKVAIEALNSLLGLGIDTEELAKEAKEMEEKLKELMKRHAETHESYKKAIDEGPSMYA